MAYCCGESPVWQLASFRERVLGNSLANATAPSAPAPSPTLTTLSEACMLVTAQLSALNQSSHVGAATRGMVAQAQGAFIRTLELCKHLLQVHDHATFFELLTTFCAQIKGMMPGSVLVIPSGWRQSKEQNHLLLVLGIPIEMFFILHHPR